MKTLYEYCVEREEMELLDQWDRDGNPGLTPRKEGTGDKLSDYAHFHAYGDWTFVGDGSHEGYCRCGETKTEACVIVNAVCTKCGTAYPTSESDLQAALNAGGTVVLSDNVELTATLNVPEGVEVTLDLNGKTINNSSGYIFENKGDLTLDGEGTLAGLGIIRSTAGKVTINSGNFYASSRWQAGDYQHTLKAENTDVVINGGNFDATVNGQTNAMLNASTGATITINGGSFKNVSGDLTNFDPYIFTYEKDGKVIINDGTFYGGTFTVVYDGQSFNASSTHVVTVYAGTFMSQTYSKLTAKLNEIVDDASKITTDAETGTRRLLS